MVNPSVVVYFENNTFKNKIEEIINLILKFTDQIFSINISENDLDENLHHYSFPLVRYYSSSKIYQNLVYSEDKTIYKEFLNSKFRSTEL